VRQETEKRGYKADAPTATKKIMRQNEETT